MKLITEICEDLEVFEEEDETGKNLFLEGIFLQSETKNRNNRIYPQEILEREVKRYNKNYIKVVRAGIGKAWRGNVELERLAVVLR